MANAFLDSFLPSLTGSLAQAGPSAIEGQLRGLEASKQLALLDLQLKAQQQQLHQQAASFPLQQQQVQEQLRMARAPQPMTWSPGSMYGIYNPLTGAQQVHGQVPVLKDPAQGAYWKALAAKATAEADLYQRFGGIKPTGNVKQMVEMKRAMGIPVTPEEDETYNTIIRQSGGMPGGVALLDNKTLDQMAAQYLAGDTSVFHNIGTGLQGAENIKRLRERITEQAQQQGVSGAEQAARIAELGGVKAGMHTLGTRSATFGMAQNEFTAMAPILLQASTAVDRTNFIPLNKALLWYKRNTGDPAVTQLDAAINTLVNIYTRAISPTGQPTVHDKEHAREILENAFSQGQLEAQLQLMQKEIEQAGKAPKAVQQELRALVPGAPAGKATDSPILQSSPLAQQKREPAGTPKNFTQAYDALTPETRQRFDAAVTGYEAGTVSDSQLLADSIAAFGVLQGNTVHDALVKKLGKRKNH